MKRTNDFPAGWDEDRVRGVLDHYENQSDEEAAAEHEAAMSNSNRTLMEVPLDLVPMFRQLIAKHQKERASD